MSDSAIVGYGNFDDAVAQPEEQRSGTQMARLRLVQGMSSAIDDHGAKKGQWMIDFNDENAEEPVILVDSLRVWFLGGPFNGRVLWADRAEMGDSGRVCGSKDGERPSPQYYETVLDDPRRPARTQVDAFTMCDQCVMSQWFKDEKGRNQSPPCKPSITMVVWLVDYNIPAIVQTDATYAIKALRGGYNRGGDNRKWTGLHEMNTGRDKQTGKLYFLRGGNTPFAPVLSSELYERGTNKFPIPKLYWSEEALSPEEYQSCVLAVQAFDQIRDRFVAQQVDPQNETASEDLSGPDVGDGENQPW